MSPVIIIEEEEAVAILVFPICSNRFTFSTSAFQIFSIPCNRPVGTRGIFLRPVLPRTKMPALPCYSYSLGNNKCNSKLIILSSKVNNEAFKTAKRRHFPIIDLGRGEAGFEICLGLPRSRFFGCHATLPPKLCVTSQKTAG